MSADRIADRLREEAERLSAGVLPPPVESLRPARTYTRSPFAAAAAVLLVVGGVGLALRDRPAAGPAGDVVPFLADTTAGRPGDAPPPIGLGAARTMATRGLPGSECTVPGLTGALALPADGRPGRLQLTWNGVPRRPTCRLGTGVPGLRLLAADGSEVARAAYAVQPRVVNPPLGDDRTVDRGGVAAEFSWQRHCGAAPDRAELTGVTAEPVPVTVTGTAPACAGDGTEGPHLGLLGEWGVVPPQRAGLRLTVEPPDRTVAGRPATLVVRLANATDRPIALTPCPHWLVEHTETLDPMGRPSGSLTGRAPCDALPPSVGPGSAVAFEVEAVVGERAFDRSGVAAAGLSVGIAGTEPWRGAVDVDYGGPPTPVATVPWRDTPATAAAPPAEVPAPGGENALRDLWPVIHELPAEVTPGTLLRYTVHVTHRGPATAVPLDPCPGFVQVLRLGDVASDVVDERYLNCADAPAAIAPGETVAFEMELRVPTGLRDTTASVEWKIGPRGLGGSESAFAELTVRS